jgi:uncharacterized protein (TIGR03437 family)
MRSTKTTLLFLLALAAFPGASSAQTYDSSGNGLLNGTYYARQVIYAIQTSEAPAGTVGEALNVQGTMTFDGNGNYTISGSYLDSSSGSVTPVTFTGSGTYVISASGEGYISAIDPEVDSTDQIVGLVSHGTPGIFIGSTTENAEGYNDLFIAAPVGSTEATNATLNGSYTAAYMDPTVPLDAYFTMNANGGGNIGAVNITGYLGTNGQSSQTLNGVTYSFSNGAAQLNLGGTASSTTLITGTELLYISPDGNFIFGGNYNGFDMFVGVRAASSNPSNSNGLYYQAGLDMDLSDVASTDDVYLDSYYGSINAFPCTSDNPCPTGATGNIIGHQRLNLPLSSVPYDFTYYDYYTLNGDGSSTDFDFSQTYWSTSDGTIRVGYGAGPVLSINVALAAPVLSGPGVFLSPQGVVNAASSAPFTAELSPGEFLTLYGTGLAPSVQSATSLPLPKSLNGVSVTINGLPAPLNYVSPTQISAVVPYFVATNSIAQIQVTNNNVPSNTVTQFTGTDSAGVFTFEPAGGLGLAAALDVTAGYSLVTTSTPAQIGDTVAVFLAGLGAVSGSPADGAAGSGNPPYNTTTNTPVVYIDDSAGNETQATVSFSGLAPGFAGLYQINLTVPSGVASGLATLEVTGANSDTLEALFPVGTPTDAATAAARARSAKRRVTHHHGTLARPTTVTANLP